MKSYMSSDFDYVHIVEIPKSEIHRIDLCICEQPKETLTDFYERQDDKPNIIVNAGFFSNITGDSCFNIKDEGKVFSKDDKYKYGIGITKDHKTIEYGSVDEKRFVDFISGYPNLVNKGLACFPWISAAEINYNSARSMIGYNDDRIFIVVVDKPGMQFTTMAKFMIDLGCKYAINLDGGSSSHLLVDGKTINNPSENKAVDSVFAIWLNLNKDKATNKSNDDKASSIKRSKPDNLQYILPDDSVNVNKSKLKKTNHSVPTCTEVNEVDVNIKFNVDTKTINFIRTDTNETIMYIKI